MERRLAEVVNELNSKNQLAVEYFARSLLELQNKSHSGKITVHVNVQGIAHKIEPMPSIIIHS